MKELKLMKIFKPIELKKLKKDETIKIDWTFAMDKDCNLISIKREVKIEKTKRRRKKK